MWKLSTAQEVPEEVLGMLAFNLLLACCFDYCMRQATMLDRFLGSDVVQTFSWTEILCENKCC